MNCALRAKDLDPLLSCLCESAELEFKSTFAPDSAQDWCELVKDIVAIANSGGGVIVFGIEDDGSPSIGNIDHILDLDPAVFGDKISKYTGRRFTDLLINEKQLQGKAVCVLIVGSSPLPLVFENPGAYSIAGTNQQRTAFGRGTVYFRHGPKSEPGSTHDLQLALERELARVHTDWLENVRKLVEAPLDATVQVVYSAPVSESNRSLSYRLTSDPSAPLVKELDPNSTHPYRQKEVVQKLNSHLVNAGLITPHDIQCIRRVHQIESKAEFCYRPRFGSCLYSEAFVAWVVSEFQNNDSFFRQAREHFRKLTPAFRQPIANNVNLLWLEEYMRKHGLSSGAAAKLLKISQSTLSLVRRGRYEGNVDGIMSKIAQLREVSS